MIDTTDVELNFGKYKGDRIQRVPVSYLLFMVNNETQQSAFAKAELTRRGTTVPTVEISGHAIDSASLRIRRTWKEQAGPREGLHSWLCKMAEKASKLRVEGDDRVDMDGVTWVFEFQGKWPVLKSVWRAKEKKSET